MSPPLPPLRPRWLSSLGWSVAALLLAAHFFSPATGVLDASLDASNYASYAAFTAQGRQYGTEVVPLAGPYGFVMYGWIYGGDLYGVRFALEFLTKLVFAALLLWFFHRARGGVARWLWLAANGFLLIAAGELAYDLLILYAALFVLLAQPRPALLAATAALLAFLALSKGTQLIFTVAVVALLAGHMAWRRAWRDLGLLVGVFFVALAAWWTLAGQSLRHLPAYVRGLSELSSGYNGAMALTESPFTFATGLAALTVTALGLALLLLPHRRHPTVAAATLLFGGFAFLQWKHGFVRADGHVFLFFYYAVVGGLTALLLDRVAGLAVRRFVPRAVLCAASVGLAFLSTGGDPVRRLREQTVFFGQHVADNFRQFAHPFAHRRNLDARLAESRVRFALPETAAHVGAASIDFFGYELGYLALNRLHDRPRPVGGGSFGVFTPRLQQLNERFLAAAATRPEFYLLKLQTIDGRFVTQDDGTTLDAILHDYRPVLAERGMLLLRTDRAAPPAPAWRSLGRHPFRLGEKIPVPAVAADEMVLAAFELPSSLAGSVRGLLYQPALVSLRVTADGLASPVDRRIVPSMVVRPFIVSPLLETTDDVLQVYTPGAGRIVRRLQLTAAPAWGLAGGACAVTFYAERRPAPVDAATRQTLAEQLSYPIANRAPASVESPHAQVREVGGRLVQLVEPPGRITFVLHGDERELEFDYGLDPETYERGTTDGADFAVDLILPGGQPEQIFLSRREPRTVAADRGRHHAQLWLPVIPPGTRLVLRTGPGRFGSAHWDWTYFDNIRLHAGPLRIEQFPGFSAVPIEAGGVWTRMTRLGDDDVLMLNAPGRLVFALSGHEHAVLFSGGLLPGAYTQGNTDGAAFVVEALRPHEPAETIYRRWLQPKTVAADRGTQSFDVPLPSLPPGTRLVVRTDPGPHGDAGWDWTYLAHLRFE